MAKLRDKLNELKEAREAYHEKAADLTTAETAEVTAHLKEIQAEIQEILTEGADDCDLGHRPLGIFHEGTPNPFEIGDPVERNKRVRAASLEEAVDKWNESDYLPPREPETIEATHADAEGNPKTSKSVKVKKA